MDSTKMDGTFRPTIVTYIFSAAHGAFSKIDHILDNKIRQNI
jgi:hypothetical protein